MRVIMSFNLPEEREEYETAYKGHRYSRVLDEICNHLRQKRKYEDQTTISIAELEEFIYNLKYDSEV